MEKVAGFVSAPPWRDTFVPTACHINPHSNVEGRLVVVCFKGRRTFWQLVPNFTSAGTGADGEKDRTSAAKSRSRHPSLRISSGGQEGG